MMNINSSFQPAYYSNCPQSRLFQQFCCFIIYENTRCSQLNSSGNSYFEEVDLGSFEWLDRHFMVIFEMLFCHSILALFSLGCQWWICLYFNYFNYFARLFILFSALFHPIFEYFHPCIDLILPGLGHFRCGPSVHPF